VLSLANHNSREQIVVTGEKGLVKELCGVVKSKGKRAVPLRVSGAFHSILMSDAADEFSRMLDSVQFKNAAVPVYSNVSAVPETDAERIRELMKEQMCAPVRWFDIVNNMYKDGIRQFVETGPGKVLTGLVKKSIVSDENDFQVFQVDNCVALKSFLEHIQ
jgi:[acyl-carrier-protein] S-malonyltransferase